MLRLFFSSRGGVSSRFNGLTCEEIKLRFLTADFADSADRKTSVSSAAKRSWGCGFATLCIWRFDPHWSSLGLRPSDFLPSQSLHVLQRDRISRALPKHLLKLLQRFLLPMPVEQRDAQIQPRLD
jgi:hypothetical protein